MLLSVLGVSSGLSRLLVGWVTDRPGVDSVVLYTVALLVAGASTCCLPALRSYQLLCGYQIVYGICCGIHGFTIFSSGKPFPQFLGENAPTNIMTREW